jgi:hypothetical protein
MWRRILIVSLVGCFLAVSPGLLAEEPGEEVTKEEAIRELLRASGAARNMEIMLEQIIGSYRMMAPEAPPELWDAIVEECDLNELLDLIVPVYDKHLTREEIDASIEFFRTPLGRSWVEKQPLVMQDSMQAGQQWGMAVAMRIQKRVQEWMAEQAAAAEQEAAETEADEGKVEVEGAGS